MSRIVSNKTIKKDLGNDEWIELRKSLSLLELQPVVVAMQDLPEVDPKDLETKEQVESAAQSMTGQQQMDYINALLPMLEMAIVSWSLKDEDGEVVEYTKEGLKLLDLETMLELVQMCTSLYLPEKKNSKPSNE